jgi:hypothetical protein
MSLFSTPSKIDIVLENDTDIKGLFKAGDVDYKVWGRYNHLMSGTSLGENVWEMFFAMCNEDEEDKMHGRHSVKPNGSGNAIKVFSTVIEFMKHVRRNTGADNIVFSAKDKKQQRMYLKLVERYQKLGIIKSVSASEKGNIIKFEVEKNAVI